MVYLDAIVPQESNLSLFARSNPERMASFQRQIYAGAMGVKPDYFDAWNDDPATIDWLQPMCTPHPVGTFQSGVTLTGRETEIARKYYILCARNHPSAFWNEYDKTLSRPGWSHDQIQSKNDAMIEAPGELAGMLHRFVSA